MKRSLLFAVIVAVGASPTPQIPSPANLLPGQLAGNVTYGPAPSGCSKYELIVGKYSAPFIISQEADRSVSTARGTGEPGPFGGVVGDGVVKGVTKALADSRGYAVQVI
jgi:hypothetical protein